MRPQFGEALLWFLLALAGCASPASGIDLLSEALDRRCRFEGEYWLTLEPRDPRCERVVRIDDADDNKNVGCSWRINGRPGVVTCEPADPIAFCEGEYQREDGCSFHVTYERSAAE